MNMPKRLRAKQAVAVSLAGLAVALRVAAADNIYTNTSSGKWETANNWSLGAPGTNDYIYLTNAGTKTVTIDATTTGSFASTMTVSDLSLGAPTTNAVNTLSLSDAGTNIPLYVLSALDLEGGAAMVISNAALRADGQTYVGGSSGSAKLTLRAGTATLGNVAVASGLGQGTLSINGGTLSIPSGNLAVAAANFSTGIVSLASGNLLMTGSGMILGSYGSGQFNVSGGTAQIPSIQIGNGAGSLGTLNLSGGVVSVPQWIWVGNNVGAQPCAVTVTTNGSLYVTNSSHTAYVDVAHNCSLTLNGGFLQLDSLILTNGGSFTNRFGTIQYTGQYEVENGTAAFLGGQVSAAGSVVAGATPGATSVVLVANSTLTISNGGLGIGNDGSTTNGSGVASATVSNALLSVTTLNIGSTAGGQGSIVVQSNSTVTVNSNITVVSGSLFSTNSMTLNGGSVVATNGITQIGPSGNGLVTITGGSHTFRQIRLGSTNGLGSGGLHFLGGYLRILGTGTAPGQGLVSNWVLWEGGDLDGSGTSLTIAETSDSEVMIPLAPGTPPINAQLDSMYVGYAPGRTGAYTQSGLGCQITVSDQMIVGDCNQGAIGNVTLNSGTLYVTNPLHTAILDVRNGTFVVNAGAVLVVDNLTMTNACGHFLRQAGGVVMQNRPALLAANLDADGDGQRNGDELAAGTDPLDPTARFQMTGVTVTNTTDLRVDWTVVAGHSYVVQAAGDLGGGGFSDLSPVITVPSDAAYGTTSWVQVGGATGAARFYRVRLQP